MIGDGSLNFTRAAGLEVDMSAKGYGPRCRRFSMVLDDGVVQRMYLEDSGFGETSAERMLEGRPLKRRSGPLRSEHASGTHGKRPPPARSHRFTRRSAKPVPCPTSRRCSATWRRARDGWSGPGPRHDRCFSMDRHRLLPGTRLPGSTLNRLPKLSRSALRVLGVDAAGERTIRAVADLFVRVAPTNLMLSGLLRTLLAGERPGGPGGSDARPAASVSTPPLLCRRCHPWPIRTNYPATFARS